ncbi:putative benzoylformate decarboxylase protein [Erysiphe necator]|uniref:Putative benzoylformate decarboxylase protein n=1 Tax=Uncinula necator TaxID=52586 RepID=A0A0B1NZB2_UNCNE|nr:putative benzoylformate decarboxylase protein [Erysiphe necator]
MTITKINSAPALDDFTPLAEHQSKTPATFYKGKPVLYFHDTQAKAIITKNHLTKLPLNGTDSYEVKHPSASSLNIVELFVCSENLTFFNPSSCIGFAIPYPAITLHAIKTLKDPEDSSQEIQGLYMQIEISDYYDHEVQEDDDSGYIDLTLIPSSSSNEGKSIIQTLFEAVSACSDLNPDPNSEDERIIDHINRDDTGIEGNVFNMGINELASIPITSFDDNLPPPFPGSGGWITADNISQYLDENGVWIGTNANSEDPMIIG